mgnify:CR=1 FL=1
MRIITGRSKGIRLVTLEGDTTRPTAERVKEAVFSMIQFDIEGRKVLDLFAGSGQLGIEALSRGASECLFCDNSRDSLRLIKNNIAHCKAEGARVVPGDFKKNDGYKRSIELSKQFGLYRQNYCGCVYSSQQLA